MTEDDFIAKWNADRAMYEAWGALVADRVLEELAPLASPISTDVYVRIPVKARLKQGGSLVTKAFYRGKNYADPYNDITDKVGVRFVVLLASQIALVQTAIEQCTIWSASKDRDFEAERDRDPYKFEYQSVHYVVSARDEISAGETKIRKGTPCEIQIRTLMQHAHSEVTHDTIYKPSVTQTPAMKRAAAKSMALVEATNDYFQHLFDLIGAAVGDTRRLSDQLTETYREAVGQDVEITPLEGALSDAYETAIDKPIENLAAFLIEKPFVAGKIKDRAKRKLLFRQPSILLVYLAVAKIPSAARNRWPLTDNELRPIFADLGEALPCQRGSQSPAPYPEILHFPRER